MYVEDDTIHIDKPPSQLDTLIIEEATMLSQHGISHAIVSGYVAVLLGRSRATEDIDVIIEPFHPQLPNPWLPTCRRTDTGAPVCHSTNFTKRSLTISSSGSLKTAIVLRMSNSNIPQIATTERHSIKLLLSQLNCYCRSQRHSSPCRLSRTPNRVQAPARHAA